MSNDGLLLRKEVRSLACRLAKDPNNNSLRSTFCNCRREFNKFKNKLKKDFFNSIIQQIEDVKPQNSKEFWNLISKYKRKESNIYPIISLNEWEKHYQSLLTTDNNEKCEIKPKDTHAELCNLDVPFTCKEIKNGIKGLKGGKSGGPDLILNEFIKVGLNTLALTLTKLFSKILNQNMEYLPTDIYLQIRGPH